MSAARRSITTSSTPTTRARCRGKRSNALGACVNAPMVMIFKDTYEDLTPERLGEIIDAFAAGKGASVPVGPQIDRIVSAPHTGLTTLRDEKAVLKTTREQGRRAEAQRGQRPMPAPRRRRRRCCRHPTPPSRRPTRPRPARRSSRRPRSRSRRRPRRRPVPRARPKLRAAEREQQPRKLLTRLRNSAAARMPRRPASPASRPRRRRQGCRRRPSRRSTDPNRPAGIDKAATSPTTSS